jgi:TolB-like protein
MQAAWPNAVVEESNLTVQIAALRKALGVTVDGGEWIVTVPRVGYRLAPIGVPANFAGDAEASGADRVSIVVLPFANLSSDPEQAFFADGLTEDLIADLSKISGITVIARNSSFSYKGRSIGTKAIAEELGVRYVVEGSVRRAADRLRIGVQLADAAADRTLWSDRFDRQLADVFKLQDEIVGRIVNALAGVLPAARPVPVKRASSLEAYDMFVRGRALVSKMARDNKEARPFLQRSIALEPGFSDAHSWLAISHHFAWTYWTEPMEPHRVLSLREARQAVGLDADSSTAHGILGAVLIYEHRLEEGAAELEAALALNPNDADALTFFGTLRMLEGAPEEGIAMVLQALRLNPHPPGWYYWLLGYGQYVARQYENAIESLRHETALDTGGRRILAASLAQLGRTEEATLEARAFLAENPHFSTSYWAWSQPFQREADRQHFIEGYLKAGLPE